MFIVGRQQVAAPVGVRPQKIVFTPSSQTVTSATVVPLLRSGAAVCQLLSEIGVLVLGHGCYVSIITNNLFHM